MALKSSKTKSKTRTKKRSTAPKGTTKRRRRKSQKKSSFKKNFFVFFGVLFVIFMVAFGYFLGNNTTQHKTVKSKTYEKDTYRMQEHLTQLSQVEKTEPKVIKEQKSPINVVKYPKEEKRILPPKEEELKIVKKEERKKVVLKAGEGKPRLAIIIDDVSSIRQLKRIQETGLKLTPSIFPPSELSMKSHKLADAAGHYMIHLPMESGTGKLNTHYKTLLVNSSTDTIEERVKEIRRLFPKARYVNNHTGSVFTGDYDAMYKLYKALNEEGFVFVDSRTTRSTKVPKVARKFDHTYIARDVFLDNEHNIPSIHQKLKEAVAIAKKKGYAIAIGHPHSVTMEALHQAKMILSDVELVYMDEIFTR